MSRLLEVIRQVVRQELAERRGSLLGVVTAAAAHEHDDDQHNYEVDLRLKHEDLELRGVPLSAGHVGHAALPRPGDLVLVQFLDGDLNQPVVSGRLYHADERVPLHREDEVLVEQRLPDGTRNHLRFTPDGSVLLQRDVTKLEDGGEAKAEIRIDGKSGDVTIAAGAVAIALLREDGEVEVSCSTMTVKGTLVVADDGAKTTISGHQITGT
jgi:uncharacterized protein involved in type VI secretion and phage assembly